MSHNERTPTSPSRADRRDTQIIRLARIPRSPTSNQSQELADAQPATSIVKMMREKLLQMSTGSPGKGHTSKTGRLSPRQREPWSKNPDLPNAELPKTNGARTKPVEKTVEESESHDDRSTNGGTRSLEQELSDTKEEMSDEDSEYDGNRPTSPAQQDLQTFSPKDGSPSTASSSSSPGEYRTPGRRSSTGSLLQQFSPFDNMSALRYALKPFVRRYNSYGAEFTSNQSTSSSMPSSQASDSPVSVSSATDAGGKRDVPLQVRFSPTPATNRIESDTRIESINVRMALVCCGMIDMRLERKVMAKDPGSTRKECDKMYKFANEALRLSRLIKSEGLQARCFYWLGRTYGRTHKWQQAERAFQNASQFEKLSTEKGDTQGLSQTEKENIDILLSSVQSRAQRSRAGHSWREKIEQQRVPRPSELTKLRKSDRERVFGWRHSPGAQNSPMWHPEKEFAFQQWTQQATADRDGKCSPRLGGGEEKGLEKWLNMYLTSEELDYIKHGRREAVRPTSRRSVDDRDLRLGRLKRLPRDHRPPPIRTSGLQSSALGIAVSGNPDRDHGTGEMVDVALDGGTPVARSSCDDNTPTTVDQDPAPPEEDVPRLCSGSTVDDDEAKEVVQDCVTPQADVDARSADGRKTGNSLVEGDPYEIL